MQQQRVILHSEQISRKGEIRYFQIPLQGNAIKVIAVEASAFLFSQVVQPVPAPQPVPPPAPQPINCLNPGKAEIYAVSQISSANGVNTQVFEVGPAVNPTFEYSAVVYSVIVTVAAVDGDTPSSIAQKLSDAINATTLATWSQYGTNNNNYKPTASVNGDRLTLTTDAQHAFATYGMGECPSPPPPQLLNYDPLFAIVQNERAGVLSLQSPDATDIFYQCDAWRWDKNISYGDFTMVGEGEWLKGRKRIAPEVNITTASPILEAYYKDSWGVYYDKDISYGLNIFVWFENLGKDDK